MNRAGLIVTAVLLLAGSMSSVWAEEKQQRFYLNPYLGAEQFERSNDFRLGSLYDGFFPTRLEDFRRDIDNTAISGGFSSGYWFTDRLALEVSFGTSRRNAIRELSITAAPTFGSMAVFPAIGAPVRVGLFSSPAVVLFPTSSGACPTCPPVGWKLNYDQNVVDTHLDARVRPWQSMDKRSWLEGVLGFAYLHINQEFDHSANGGTTAGFASTIVTNIDLTDNLFGGRVGARGQYRIWRDFTLMGEAFGEFYHRNSNLSAEQEISNPGILRNFGGGAFTTSVTAPAQYSARVSVSDSRFVPRFSGKFRLAYDFADWASLGFMYRFNALWNMSRPDAPTVISPTPGVNSAPILDHSLRIKDDDRIFSHFYGLELAIKF